MVTGLSGVCRRNKNEKKTQHTRLDYSIDYKEQYHIAGDKFYASRQLVIAITVINLH